jgi:glycosyltransferase involved in cell wall biosynthesis
MANKKKTIYLAIDGNEANVNDRVGSNVYAWKILCQLHQLTKKSKHWQITILLARPKVSDLPKSRKNWRYVYVQPTKLWTQWALPIHLFLHRSDYDVFFTPGHYAPRFSPIPYISSVMDLAYLHFADQFRPEDLLQLRSWTKYSVKNAKKILTISQFSKSEIIKHYGRRAEDIIVAPPASNLAKSANQQDSQKFFKKHGIKRDYFLYLGTLQPRKNLLSLLNAYDVFLMKLLEQSSQAKDKVLSKAPQLVIAGKIGWLNNDLLEKINKFVFKEKIIVTGFVPARFKKTLYQRAKLSFLLSLYEGFGIPPLESIEAGCLPIVANNSSLSEVVADPQLTVDPQDYQAIAQKMLKFSQFTKKQYQSVLKKRQNHIKQFSWQKSAQAILRQLKKLAESQHG